MMQRFIALLLLLYAVAPTSQASAAVVITFDDTLAQVDDVSTYDGDDQFNTGGTTAVATVMPDYSSTVTSLFNPAIMSGSFDQSRAGDVLDGYSDGYVSSKFTIDANTSYTAGGSYSNTGGVTYFGSQLYDATADVLLFESVQESHGGVAAFTLGGTAGNFDNNFEGSLTGTLLAGHNYEWWSDAYTLTGDSLDGGATASGGVTLTIGNVPEPSTMVLFGLGATGFSIASLRRRNKIRR